MITEAKARLATALLSNLASDRLSRTALPEEAYFDKHNGEKI